jgi:hypothetical protein
MSAKFRRASVMPKKILKKLKKLANKAQVIDPGQSMQHFRVVTEQQRNTLILIKLEL